MANYSVSPEADRGKTHPHLKSNAGFLRHYAHRAAVLHQLRESSEERDREPTLASEMLAQGVPRAEM
jgi:hypothetical protein